MKRVSYLDDGLWFRDDALTFERDAAALPLSFQRGAPPTDVIVAAPTTPTSAKEVAFLNGINASDRITKNSYWGSVGETAFKWGDNTAGTGATITYAFQGTSNFTAQEKATFLMAFAMWSSVADVTFVEAGSQGSADVLLRRGNDNNAYCSTPTSNGSGSTLGQVTGQALISIDTTVPGFDLSGSFDTVGGYGLSTVVHEVGHLLGLGHGGAYNGAVNPDTQQFSAYDDRMYTIMSYISWGDGNTKFSSQNPVKGTDWGVTDDGYLRQAPHSIMSLDILAIQQLYGDAATTPVGGGQTYGFNCNIAGPLNDFFDFTVNTTPVVTLFNEGLGNTLDCSGYNMAQTIDLRSGAFSDVGGVDNNVCIATDTRIDTAIGGSGNDRITANDFLGQLFGNGGADSLFGGAGGDSLFGRAGKDTMTGGGSADMFVFELVSDSAKKSGNADVITDFSNAQNDRIDLSAIDAISGGANDAFTFIGSSTFGGNAGELRFQTISGGVLVSGDVDGNGSADFAIRLNGVSSMAAADFVL